MRYRSPFHSIFRISILALMVLFTSCVSTKFRVEKTPLDKYFETNTVFRESHSGLMVYDVKEKTILFDYNAYKHFIPASNTKLLTYFATVQMAEDSIPAIEYCIANDTLYFTGTGDPTLLCSEFGHGKTMYFLSENELPMVHIPKVMDGSRFGSGWAWDDYPYYFSPEKSSFPIYGNMVDFQKEIDEDRVEVAPDYFENNLIVQQDSAIEKYRLERSEISNEFNLRFHETPLEIDSQVPFVYSEGLFEDLLSDTLKASIFHEDSFPDCNKKILYSVPTDSVSKYILMDSDNFLAEQMLLLLSNQLGDTLSGQKTMEFILENHLQEFKDQIKWVDGSGLSRYNQITPTALAAVLEKLYAQVPKEKLYQLLPESGTSGSLKSSFQNLEGSIHAKTGSMRYVYNLSGYLETKSGKTLIFSFMNNNFNVSFSELRFEMEKVLAVFVNDN